MRCSEIINILEELAPHRMACEWDNPGLLAGRKEKEVKKLLLCVDADDEAVALAVRQGADMIVSHHPLIFRSIKRVTDEDFIGRRLVEMIQSDLSYFAMHTNFDSAPGCMADLAAERIGICGGEPLEAMGEENGVLYGIGKTGSLETPVTGMELARRVKETFGLPFVAVYGEGLWEKEPALNISNCLGDSSSICSFLYSSMVFFPLLVNPLEKSLLSFSSKSGRPNCAILVYILSVISHSTPLASILSATSRCSLIVGTAMINFLAIQFFTISAYCSVFPKAVCAFIMWISAFLAATASSSIFLSTDTHLSIL